MNILSGCVYLHETKYKLADRLRCDDFRDVFDDKWLFAHFSLLRNIVFNLFSIFLLSATAIRDGARETERSGKSLEALFEQHATLIILISWK